MEMQDSEQLKVCELRFAGLVAFLCFKCVTPSKLFLSVLSLLVKL